MPVFGFGLTGEAFGEGTFEGFGVAGEDVGDAVEAVEVKGVEETDAGFVEKPVAELAVVEEVGPADAGAVVPGLAELEGCSAVEQEAEHRFVFGEGSGGVNGGVVFDGVGVEAEIEREADGFDAFGSNGFLDHVVGGAFAQIRRLGEHGLSGWLIACKTQGDETLYVVEVCDGCAGGFEELGDFKIAALHGVLPSGAAVKLIGGGSAVVEKDLDLLRFAANGGDAESPAHECGARFAILLGPLGLGGGFEAVAEEDFKAVIGIVAQGFFVGGVGTAGEKKFGEFAVVGMGRLVGVAGRSAAEDSGERGEPAGGLVEAFVGVALEREDVGVGAAIEEKFCGFQCGVGWVDGLDAGIAGAD